MPTAPRSRPTSNRCLRSMGRQNLRRRFPSANFDSLRFMHPPEFNADFRRTLRVLVAWRRDVRRFRGDPLPEGRLGELIELANLAPSVGLSQPWRFVVVEDPARRAAIRANFANCNAQALAAQPTDRMAQYARLKLAGLDEAPCHLAV